MGDIEGSVVGGLTPFEWHDATAAARGTAVEEINQVVGGYASLVSAAADNPGGSSPADQRGIRVGPYVPDVLVAPDPEYWAGPVDADFPQ